MTWRRSRIGREPPPINHNHDQHPQTFNPRCPSSHVFRKPRAMNRLATTLIFVTLTGCGMQSLEEQTKKSPNGIIGKKTQDIGQFDPKAGTKVSDSKIAATDMITAPVSAYGPMLEKISKSHIEHAVRLFEATEGRYPKDYDEFFEKIVKANNIQLPVLPGGKKYQYDVENHKLEVIDAPAAAAPATATP